MNQVEVATRIRSLLSLRGLPDLAKAACKRSDPELFFPAPGTGSGTQVSTAKRICGQCPERSACLDWALRDAQTHGIWGGKTEAERRELRLSVKGWQ